MSRRLLIVVGALEIALIAQQSESFLLSLATDDQHAVAQVGIGEVEPAEFGDP